MCTCNKTKDSGTKGSGMMYDNCIDSATPLNVALSAKYKRSFGYITAKDRWPVILTQIVDHMSRDKENIIKECGEEAQEELKTVIGKISKLKNELQTNKPLVPIDSSSSDVIVWNKFLKQAEDKEGAEPRWYDIPWLGVECYMYRRVYEAFEKTKSLTAFDPFLEKKQAALLSSLDTIEVLAVYVTELLQTKKCDDIMSEFIKLLYVDLWGNRCDLSLSTGKQVVLNEDPIQKIEQLSEFILTNEVEKVWNVLSTRGQDSEVIVDIIMDNAGYELFTDLCLADFIITFSLASEVRFRVKAIPFYVSDTRIPDFHWTLQTLSNSKNSSISGLADRWCGYIDAGKWKLFADNFWVGPYVFSYMETIDPTLYQELTKAVLLIFKGDLNYRKLVGDVNWEPTKPFSEALCGFQPTNILTLRTLKADTICGLLPGQAEAVAEKHFDWLLSGQYAVIQFSSV